MHGQWHLADDTPVSLDTVLVFLDCGVYALGYYTDGWHVPDEPPSYKVTHWIELPGEPE